MFGECHAHMIMDGVNYKKAVAQHKDGVVDAVIRQCFEEYTKRGIFFIRDGGDACGVSKRAAQLACEYGITYRTPVFALHKRGHYGGIVGLPFSDFSEYRDRIAQVRAQGGHFIKLMFSGILDFSRSGAMTEAPLQGEEIRELIHIAHEEGFSVMAHVNGAAPVLAAVEAGVDSVEHGNFLDEEALQALSESHTVWVPTYVTITNLIGSGRFDDSALEQLKKEAGARIRRGFALGASIALGSDAGAYRVLHGQGLLDEYRELSALLTAPRDGAAAVSQKELDARLLAAEKRIRERF